MLKVEPGKTLDSLCCISISWRLTLMLFVNSLAYPLVCASLILANNFMHLMFGGTYHVAYLQSSLMSYTTNRMSYTHV
jgi:hypothetical protein